MIERLVLILALIKGSVAEENRGKRFIIATTTPLPAAVGGVTCELDPVCFQFAIDCAFNADDIEPFLRVSPVDCLECSALCQQYRNGSFDSTCYCRSAVWDACDKTCDIYSIKAPSISILDKHPGRIYMQPTYNCRYPVPPTEPPVLTEPPIRPIPSCPNATDVGKMLGVMNRLFQNITGEQLLGVSDDRTCAGYCLTNQLPNGTTFRCKSAQFLNGICTVSPEEALSATELVPTDQGTYYQKFCFPASYVKGCPDVFLEEPQMILVGVNKQTVDAVSLQACMKACLTSLEKYGFSCKSVMFYYQDLDQNCILNEETKTTRSRLFAPAPENDEVSYVEVGCQGTANKRPVEAAARALLHKDIKHFVGQKENVKGSDDHDSHKLDGRRSGSRIRRPSAEGRTTRKALGVTPPPNRARPADG